MESFKPLKIKSIRAKRSVRTFTVTMEARDHNFITADGVVHANSFNKCLIGSTKVVRGAAGPHGGNQITLDELHAAWHSNTGWGAKLRREGVTLLQMDEDGRIRPGKCIGVYYQGKQSVYKVKLENGGRIIGTANHRLLTTKGYKQIDELVPGVTELVCVGEKDTGYKKRGRRSSAKGNHYEGRGFQDGEKNPAFVDGNKDVYAEMRMTVLERSKGCCEHCGTSEDKRFEFAHIDKRRREPIERLRYNTAENILYLCNSCHKKFDYEKGERKRRWTRGRPTMPLKVVSVAYAGKEDTFDVEMDTPGHNFLANGIVSHNSHSLAYAWVAYQMAWFKHYYPPIFYIGILRHDTSAAQTFLLEAAAKGIRIMPPHVNHSSHLYEYRDKAIYLPLNAVSNLGEKGAQCIYEERTKNGPYKTFKGFNDRIQTSWCNSRARRFIYQLGGFDGLEGHPGDAIKHLDEIEPMTPFEAQLELLGYVLPTKTLAARLARAEESGALVGFIQSHKEKTSGYGAYRIFKLSPRGSFWARQGDQAYDLEYGDLVEVKKMRSGRVKKAEKIVL